MKQKKIYTSLIPMAFLLFLVVGCSQDQTSDAYGQFEAEEVTVSAETSGILKSFTVQEGMKLEEGQKAGQVDSTQLALRKDELLASVASIRTNIAKLEAQADVYREQLNTAQKDLQRFTNLKQNNAATQQQIDQAQGQVNVLNKQINSVEVQKQSVYAELQTMKARIAQVEDQIKKTQIINPVSGTVLSSFAEQGELVTTGKPLYEIANLEEMILRVYVSGAQLPNVILGEQAEVLIDKNTEENESLTGVVRWIASEAEFTPRMIQTKEERVTQVYAVEITVPNPDGKLKIGMPGEVNFR
ncbi:HlyD family secretion protein [Gracilimonas sediminicola]|uniref:Efflux RND transporter periplasmic adaptor subunit n=1 Tax=Gracilimonas sediminicola TaxID=2952158 RepID=A0A9X2REG4_9BACT|nr:efflux RND transporter periplasmic adaptor subunit [Gracilimonas sediminicola]MCP9291940.1 efflux RND transporter periplasmic adaptor subunit [Gracilimonas sediminicola]